MIKYLKKWFLLFSFSIFYSVFCFGENTIGSGKNVPDSNVEISYKKFINESNLLKRKSTTPIIEFVTSCSPSIDQAVLVYSDQINQAPKEIREKVNYCIVLNDPTIPEEISSFAPNAILVFVTLPPSNSDNTYELVIEKKKGIPVCTECDESCFKLKKEIKNTDSYYLSTTENEWSNHLINLNFNSDEYLISYLVELTLKLKKKVVLQKAINKSWSWCM